MANSRATTKKLKKKKCIKMCKRGKEVESHERLLNAELVEGKRKTPKETETKGGGPRAGRRGMGAPVSVNMRV